MNKFTWMMLMTVLLYAAAALSFDHVKCWPMMFNPVHNHPAVNLLLCNQ